LTTYRLAARWGLGLIIIRIIQFSTVLAECGHGRIASTAMLAKLVQPKLTLTAKLHSSAPADELVPGVRCCATTAAKPGRGSELALAAAHCLNSCFPIFTPHTPFELGHFSGFSPRMLRLVANVRLVANIPRHTRLPADMGLATKPSFTTIDQGGLNNPLLDIDGLDTELTGDNKHITEDQNRQLLEEISSDITDNLRARPPHRRNS
jgi:hypothetical protein